MLLVATLTLFRARHFYAEALGRTLARASLWLHGVRLNVHGEIPRLQPQVVYISNHTSALDPPIVVALGFLNSRYFMSGFLRKLVPLWIVGSLLGFYWTPPQRRQQKRRKLFRRVSDELLRSGESVFL